MIDQGKCARYSAPNGTLPFPPPWPWKHFTRSALAPGVWKHTNTSRTHMLTLIITYTARPGTPWPPLCSEKHTQPSFCLSGPAVAPFATGYRCSWCQLTNHRRAGCCRSRSPAFCFSALFFISLLMCFQGRWYECVCGVAMNTLDTWPYGCLSRTCTPCGTGAAVLLMQRSMCPLYVCDLCTFMVFAKVCIIIMSTIIIAHRTQLYTFRKISSKYFLFIAVWIVRFFFNDTNRVSNSKDFYILENVYHNFHKNISSTNV